jgi:hypothetical protein
MGQRDQIDRLDMGKEGIREVANAVILAVVGKGREKGSRGNTERELTENPLARNRGGRETMEGAAEKIVQRRQGQELVMGRRLHRHLKVRMTGSTATLQMAQISAMMQMLRHHEKRYQSVHRRVQTRVHERVVRDERAVKGEKAVQRKAVIQQ